VTGGTIESEMYQIGFIIKEEKEEEEDQVA
jgi:hypothetical protein